tara:strand:- start:13290 stop:13592 length:303 start_codon:yes stop_codon:yes gene_type:complete
MEGNDQLPQEPKLKYPLVLVSWYDAKDGGSGWHSIEDIQKEKLATCYSMGWMVLKDGDRVVIMSDYSNDENSNDGGRHIVIPSGWVKSITYLGANYKETK